MHKHTINRYDFLKTLLLSSYLYLALPYALFVLGYLKPWAYVAFGIGLLAGLYLVLRASLRTAQTYASAVEIRTARLGFLALAMLGWVCLSGIGGYGYQAGDWAKHNAVLYTLIEQPWPATIDYGHDTVAFVYYTGFYVPAALAGKMWGWAAANQVLFVWGYLGTLIACLWFCLLVRSFSIKVVLFFVFFDSPDLLGALFYSLIEGRALHVEHWGGIWQFSSFTTLLYWAPNQALAGWILSGLALFSIQVDEAGRCLVFLVSLALLWSVFVFAGLVLFLPMYLVLRGQNVSVRTWVNLPNLVGLGLIVLLTLYYAAKFTLPVAPGQTGVSFGFIYQFLPANTPAEFMNSLFRLIGFLVIAAGLYVALLTRLLGLKHRSLIIAIFLTLFIALHIKVGFYNDFAMRASIPAFFLLGVLVCRALVHATTRSLLWYGLLCAVMLGSATPGIQLGSHLSRLARGVERLQTVSTLPALGEIDTINTEFFYQYAGARDSFFFRVFARAGDPTPTND